MMTPFQVLMGTMSKSPFTVEWLAVGGGAGGGVSYGGPGGGGGEVLFGTALSFPSNTSINVTVGSGGGSDSDGGNTIFGGIATSRGGKAAILYASGNGFPGGLSDTWSGGGGGGAGGPGIPGTFKGFIDPHGNGGIGLKWPATDTYYGGGGGGGIYWAGGHYSQGPGGLGGGGDGAAGGASQGSNIAGNGTVGTGGGGGGSGDADGLGGSGGSGTVVIRYRGAPQATGGTITQTGGFTYHTFNTSGTFASVDGIYDPDYFKFVRTISANTANYNIRTAAIAAGWDGLRPIVARIFVNPGIVVTSASDGTPAFDTGLGIPIGSVLELINSGDIVGAGGTGGTDYNGSAWGPYHGNGGGIAFRAQYPIKVTNTGKMVGGGGGGGCGLAFYNPPYSMYAFGGGGGGGAGRQTGPGGIGGASGGWGTAGNGASASGDFVTPGAGGGGGGTSYAYQYQTGTDAKGNPVYGTAYYYGYGGNGGIGGAPGSAGTAGTVCTSPTFGSGYFYGLKGNGGGAGPAVLGNAIVTWISTGTRTGPIT